jgi:hypothetical protein
VTVWTTTTPAIAGVTTGVAKTAARLVGDRWTGMASVREPLAGSDRPERLGPHVLAATIVTAIENAVGRRQAVVAARRPNEVVDPPAADPARIGTVVTGIRSAAKVGIVPAAGTVATTGNAATVGNAATGGIVATVGNVGRRPAPVARARIAIVDSRRGPAAQPGTTAVVSRRLDVGTTTD